MPKSVCLCAVVFTCVHLTAFQLLTVFLFDQVCVCVCVRFDMHFHSHLYQAWYYHVVASGLARWPIAKLLPAIPSRRQLSAWWHWLVQLQSVLPCEWSKNRSTLTRSCRQPFGSFCITSWLVDGLSWHCEDEMILPTICCIHRWSKIVLLHSFTYHSMASTTEIFEQHLFD